MYANFFLKNRKLILIGNERNFKTTFFDTLKTQKKVEHYNLNMMYSSRLQSSLS